MYQFLIIAYHFYWKAEYRGLHSFGEYRADYRPVGPNLEHHIQVFNKEQYRSGGLNIGQDIRMINIDLNIDLVAE